MKRLKPQFQLIDTIKTETVILKDEDDKLLGTLTKEEAVEIARERDRDLVVISDTSTPPVVKLCILEKYIYMKSKRDKEQKKKSVKTKQISFRFSTGANDVTTKLKHIEGFLNNGDRVIILMKFRRKERDSFQLGKRVMEDLQNKIGLFGRIERGLLEDNGVLSIIAMPQKKLQKQ